MNLVNMMYIITLSSYTDDSVLKETLPNVYKIMALTEVSRDRIVIKSQVLYKRHDIAKYNPEKTITTSKITCLNCTYLLAQVDSILHKDCSDCRERQNVGKN